MENGIIDTNREKKELELQVFELEKNIAGKIVLVLLVLGLFVLAFIATHSRMEEGGLPQILLGPLLNTLSHL